MTKKFFFDYVITSSKDLKLLPKNTLKNILSNVQQIHNSNNIIFKDFSPADNDIIVFCICDNAVVGYIQVVPEFDFEQVKPLDYFVDFICIHNAFKNKGIANNLYLRAFLILRKIKANKVSAILIDEYSKQAFDTVSNYLNLEIKHNGATNKSTSIFNNNQNFEK